MKYTLPDDIAADVSMQPKQEPPAEAEEESNGSDG